MNTYLPYILPAVITALLNIIFYLLIKKSVDNSLEKYKISYSGVFKEKIDIYKNLLQEVHDLKLKVNQYQLVENDEFRTEVQTSFNKLIRLYSVNRPFLSDKLIELFKASTTELQSIYESFVMGRIKNYGNMPDAEVQRREKQYWDAVNKLREGKVLGNIEENIINEMRRELQTN